MTTLTRDEQAAVALAFLEAAHRIGYARISVRVSRGGTMEVDAVRDEPAAAKTAAWAGPKVGRGR
jgi:hypothetical protein